VASSALVLGLAACRSVPGDAAVAIVPDDARGTTTVVVDGVPAVTWCHGADLAFPHWLLSGPSGRPLLDPAPEPYPHHRALWIADKVQLGDGPVVDFYHCTKNVRDDGDVSRYRHAIRHRRFTELAVRDGVALLAAEACWEVDGQPVLDDERRLTVTPLGAGEVLLDLRWTLRASHGPVHFHSDAVHYAWPYLRLRPEWSVARGGTMVDDQGREGQQATHGQEARWIDCSATVDGATEGVAVFLPPDQAPRRWLTRDYGCFGPRRAAALDGTRFTLARGAALEGRVVIFVHRGDHESGRVAERYRDFVRGEGVTRAVPSARGGVPAGRRAAHVADGGEEER